MNYGNVPIQRETAGRGSASPSGGTKNPPVEQQDTFEGRAYGLCADGRRKKRTFALDRQTEPLVMPSEISGLDDLRGFLKHGNYVARFSFPFIALEEKHPGFVERDMDDLIAPSRTPPPEPEPQTGHALVPEHIGGHAALGFDEGVE